MTSHRCPQMPSPPDAPPRPDLTKRHDEITEQMALVMGAANVAAGQLVLLVKDALEEDLAGGSGLRSPAHWVAWRTGLSAEHSNAVVKLAKRATELPVTITMLVDGRLTLDQAAVIARHVRAPYEADAAEMAQYATVSQLRDVLSNYGYDEDKPHDPEPVRERASTGEDRKGQWRLSAALDDDRGAIVDAALKAKREDLYRQRRAEAPEGERVDPVSLQDAIVALAEESLDAGQADHPGNERYLVHLHLQAGTEGPVLANHLGSPLSEDLRRMILCDCLVRATTWDRKTPVDVGRRTRTVPAKVRHLIEHRDRGCAVPGCHRTVGLHIHHITHWEDGGATDADNLVTLCAVHHRMHHQGLLGVTRTPGIEQGESGWITFADRHGQVLDPCGKPIARCRPAGTPGERARATARASGLAPGQFNPPLGERVDRSAVTLNRR